MLTFPLNGTKCNGYHVRDVIRYHYFSGLWQKIGTLSMFLDCAYRYNVTARNCLMTTEEWNSIETQIRAMNDEVCNAHA